MVSKTDRTVDTTTALHLSDYVGTDVASFEKYYELGTNCDAE